MRSVNEQRHICEFKFACLLLIELVSLFSVPLSVVLLRVLRHGRVLVVSAPHPLLLQRVLHRHRIDDQLAILYLHHRYFLRGCSCTPSTAATSNGNSKRLQQPQPVAVVIHISPPPVSLSARVSVGVIIAPFIYMFAAVTAYYLYKELKNVVNEAAAGGAGAEEMGGGGYAAQREAPPAPAGSGQGWSHAESHPSAPSGFKAFSGTGNRLGGS